jgi:hypothetical protein
MAGPCRPGRTGTLRKRREAGTFVLLETNWAPAWRVDCKGKLEAWAENMRPATGAQSGAAGTMHHEIL